jgi:PEP-CTERM motif
MKKKMLFVAAATLLSVWSTQAGATPIVDLDVGLADRDTLLTFNEVPLTVNVAVTNQYSAYGLTVQGLNYSSSCCISTWSPGGSKPYLANVTTSASAYSNWKIEFADDLTAIAFTLAANSGTYNLAAYQNGSLVEQFNLSGSAWGYYGFKNIVFDEIRMTAASAMLIDNLQFKKAGNVPEPGVIALLGAAAVAAMVTRRRKYKA